MTLAEGAEVVSVFRGQYPSDLERVVRHAKRLAKLLAQMEQARADAWFFGRAGELRGVVTLAVSDWRAGARDCDAASRAIVSYLDGLHRGASRKLKCGIALECCELDDVITSVGEDEEDAPTDAGTGSTRAGRTTAGPTVPAAWKDGPEVLARVRDGLDWVDRSARALARRMGGASVTLDDLRGFGRGGLLDAARAFDEGRGMTFEQWASVAIRNAIVDGVRREGALSSRERRWLLRAGGVRSAPEDAVGSTQGASEPQSSFDNSDERLHEAGFASGPAASVADFGDGLAPSPEEALAKAQLAALLRTLVAKLPKNERTLIERTYFGGERLEDAAAALGLSRSWATHAHARAIEAIEEGLRKKDRGLRPGGGAWRTTKS